MRIGFVGAGKAGTAVGKFFQSAGLRLSGYASLHFSSAVSAAAFTDSKAYPDARALASDSDCVFFSVPDGAVKDVFEPLKPLLEGKAVCHLSGVLTAAEVFGDTPLACSVHPLYPLSGAPDCWEGLKDAVFSVEGGAEAADFWEKTLREIGVAVKILKPGVKSAYHAACACASNLVCALFDVSTRLLEGCGFDEDESLRALAPLARANLEHILADGPGKALTGPVERGDSETLRRHLAAMPDETSKELYRAGCVSLVAMARSRRADYPEEQMLKILNQP